MLFIIFLRLQINKGNEAIFWHSASYVFNAQYVPQKTRDASLYLNQVLAFI